MDLTRLTGTKIVVFVDEALPDIIVVSYVHEAKIFRGVLLDSTKRNLPCGVHQLNPAFSKASGKPDDDVLYSVNQRYAYTDPSTSTSSHISTTPAENRLKNNKISKMTVRLRPRQVLCSKCKDICNENSESITRKRKAVADVAEVTTGELAVPIVVQPQAVPTQSPPKRGANAPVTRSSSALSGIVNKLNIYNNNRSKAPLSVQSKNTIDEVEPEPLKRVIITRKKSQVIDNESVNNNRTGHEQTGILSTRTLKICYGPQGEGTVLKIPAQIDPDAEIETEDEDDVPEENDDEEASRVSRKAMKKAKKDKAKKKTMTLQTTVGSPEQSSSRCYATSTSYSIGSSSPRYTVGSASPRHGLGNNSPRFVASLPPIPVTSFEPTPRKRKHKVKHKKKHKEDRDRKHKDDKEEKDGGLTQKLSINLKRLSGTYTTATTTTADSTCTSTFELEPFEDQDRDDESSSDEVPDFPAGPIRFQLNAKHVNSALSAEGEPLFVGDIVWGKLQGFPWWPAKILTITDCDSGSMPQANVTWYGSSASSLIECDQLSLYLDNFKARFNKKKRGPYKDAIKQATHEAHIWAEFKMAANEPAPHESPPPSAATATGMIMLVPPALASPREINVIS